MKAAASSGGQASEGGDDLLQRVIADAGRWAFGTIYVEVWIQTDDRTQIYCPEGGRWLDPSFHVGCDDSNCATCRLTNENNPSFKKTRPTVPGVELSGVLWSEVIHHHHHPNRNPSRIPSVSPTSNRHRDRNHTESVGCSAGQKSPPRIRNPGFISPPAFRKPSPGPIEPAHLSETKPVSTFASRKPSRGLSSGPMRSSLNRFDQTDIEAASRQQEGAVFSPSKNSRNAQQDSATVPDTSTSRLRRRSDSMQESATLPVRAVSNFLPSFIKRNHIVWRDMKAMSNNPHLPYDPRIDDLVKMGLGWVTGLSFHSRSTKGLVLFMARKNVDHTRLHSAANEEYLKAATDLIGSVWAIRAPRRQSEMQRKTELDAALRRAKWKVLAVIWISGNRVDWTKTSLGSPEIAAQGKDDNGDSSWPKLIQKAIVSIQDRAITTVKKCKGAGRSPPPPFSNKQSLLTAVGSAVTLFSVTRFSFFMQESYGDDFAVALPPFGALIALQFGLTAAPAAQPRTAILGQILSLGIALGVAETPDLPPWARQTIATSLSIGLMVRLGITHPPAGAAALAFSNGQFRWTNALMLLVGNLIAVFWSTVINNVSEKRQYPTFWGVARLWKAMELPHFREGRRMT